MKRKPCSKKLGRALTYGLLLALIGVAASQSSAHKKSAGPVRVYVYTRSNEGGFVDADQKQRNDSVEDLRKALDKKGQIKLVGQPEEADVALVVLGRGGEDTGTVTTRPGPFGTSNSSSDTIAAVRVAVVPVVGAGPSSYTKTFEGYGGQGQIFGVWRTAANNAAKQIEAWIKANHDTLIARRAQQ